MATQEIKGFLDMSSEELDSYLKTKMSEKFGNSKKTIHKHTDYLEMSTHNSNDSLDKKVTLNGAKFIDDIIEEDHLFTVGETKSIMDGD